MPLMYLNVLTYIVLVFGYLTTLLVLRLQTTSNRMVNEYGAAFGMRVGKGNQAFCVPLPLHPPHILELLIWDRTQDVVGNQYLTA